MLVSCCANCAPLSLFERTFLVFSVGQFDFLNGNIELEMVTHPTLWWLKSRDCFGDLKAWPSRYLEVCHHPIFCYESSICKLKDKVLKEKIIGQCLGRHFDYTKLKVVEVKWSYALISITFNKGCLKTRYKNRYKRFISFVIQYLTYLSLTIPYKS